MELRMQLSEVLASLQQLQAHVIRTVSWEPADRLVPTFSDRTRSGDAWISARGHCCLTPDSVLFVHGPLGLFFVVALAEELLEAGDRVSGIKEFKLHKELSDEPVITVWDPASGIAPPPVDRRAICFQGCVTTASGRDLNFAAVPDPTHPITAKMGYHAVVPAISRSRPAPVRETGGCIDYDLQQIGWPESGRTVKGAAAVYALMEMLVTITSQALDDGNHLFMFSAGGGLAVPEDLGAWLELRPRFQLELFWDRKRTVPGRGFFIPMRYRLLPDTKVWCKEIMACLDGHMLI
jgi:hypothetical protein